MSMRKRVASGTQPKLIFRIDLTWGKRSDKLNYDVRILVMPGNTRKWYSRGLLTQNIWLA